MSFCSSLARFDCASVIVDPSRRVSFFCISAARLSKQLLVAHERVVRLVHAAALLLVVPGRRRACLASVFL